MAEMPRILGVRINGILEIGDDSYAAHRVGIYQPIARKADGVKTLRLVGNVGPKFKDRTNAEVFAEQYCAENEDKYFFFPEVPEVKHGYLFDDLPDGIHTYFDFLEAME